jgi:hypothetical protein
MTTATATNETKRAPKAARYSIHCKGCGKHATIEIENKQGFLSDGELSALRSRFGRITRYGEDAKPGASIWNDMLRCCRYLRVNRINGRYSADHKCDGRCTNAKGGDCECQCGGKNHGSGYSVAA